MTLEQKAAHLDSIIYSDAFDELVVYRLKMSLKFGMEGLEKWSKIEDLEIDRGFQDYLDTIKYCKSLVTVIQAFCTEDYTDTIVQLNKYSLVLEEIF
jgi:hypothetical protein